MRLTGITFFGHFLATFRTFWTPFGHPMSEKKATKYAGVLASESKEKRFRGKPDICYTIDYRDETGKRIRKAIGWASQGMTAALAAQIRTEKIAAIKRGDAPTKERPPVPTLMEAWQLYKKDWLEANGKDANLDDARVRHNLDEVINLPLNEITSYRLDQLMANLKERGYSSQTIRHAVGLVRRIMRRMVKWQLYDGKLPFENITLPRLNNTRERFLSPDEARRLLDELKKRSPTTWLMALISLQCGLRFGEIARLRFSDIDRENMTIFIAESKNGRSRHAVMTMEVADAIAKLFQVSDIDLLFPTQEGKIRTEISNTFEKTVADLGFNTISGQPITDRRQRVVFHTLRHTYASWLAKGGQGQAVIADRLGHRSLQMTARYTHLMDESRRVSADIISNFFHNSAPENRES